MDELVKLMTTVGFPAAVTLFVLVRVEQSLKDLRDAIERLRADLPLACPYDRAGPPRKVSS